MIKKQKGFTLIELLVVIAIIGILAGILVVAINPKAQTDKADDVVKKNNLKQIKTLSVLYLDNHNNSFLNLCDESNIKMLTDNVNAICYDDSDSWAAEVVLSETTNENRYCIDSISYVGDTSSALGVDDTSCNQ